MSHLLKVMFNMCLVKVWTAINRLLIIWKSDLSNKIKQDFFQTAVVSILLNGSTPWTLTTCIEEKLDEISQECYKIFWTNPGSNTTRKTATVQPLTSHLKNHPRGTRHVSNIFYGPLNLDLPALANQQEFTNTSLMKFNTPAESHYQFLLSSYLNFSRLICSTCINSNRNIVLHFIRWRIVISH